MAERNLNFTEDLNISLQIGDMVYYTTTTTSGSFNVSGTSPQLVGIVTGIDGLNVVVDDEIGGNDPLDNWPSDGDFIMFLKDSSINISGLTGYYAEAKFVNDSKSLAEIFSIGCEIDVSSK